MLGMQIYQKTISMHSELKIQRSNMFEQFSIMQINSMDFQQ